MSRVLLYLALIAALAMPEAFAQAAHAGGSFFERVLPGARQVGSGEFKVLGFKIYDAQFWSQATSGVTPVARGGQEPSKWMEHPFALNLRYARNLKGEEIAQRSLGEMQRLGLGDEARHERWLSDMKKIFPNVARGDQITGVFQPGSGTRFYFNENLIGRVEEAEFALAFFSIWLDPRTRAPSLREALLKGSQ